MFFLRMERVFFGACLENFITNEKTFQQPRCHPRIRFGAGERQQQDFQNSGIARIGTFFVMGISQSCPIIKSRKSLYLGEANDAADR